MRGHSRHAGMACINHWIPACAGMTAGAHYRRLVIPAKAGIQEGRVGMRHGSRLLPTRWSLPRGHSRYAGMTYINHRISACAGMTAGAHYRRLVIPAKAGIQEGRVGMRHGSRLLPTRWSLPRGHSRYAGMTYINHRISACAGMTAGLTTGASSFRRKPESRRAESGCGTDRGFSRPAGIYAGVSMK